MTDINFSSPNIPQDVKYRTQEFFVLIQDLDDFTTHDSGRYKFEKYYMNSPSKSYRMDEWTLTEEYKNAHKEYEQKLLDLLKQGIDINALNYIENTILMSAAFFGSTEVFEFIIGKIKDINATNIYGYNALKTAASNGYDEIVEILIKNKANVFDNSGDLDALRCATYNQWPDVIHNPASVVRHLTNAGANIYFADDEGNITKDLIKKRLSDVDYNTIIVAGESFYTEFAKGKYPDTVEDALKLVAFHPISPSDNREPFPKIDILRKILIGSWDPSKTRLKKVEGLIDALKDRGTINETECAQLKDACLYKIAALSTHKGQNSAKTESELTR